VTDGQQYTALLALPNTYCVIVLAPRSSLWDAGKQWKRGDFELNNANSGIQR